MPRRILVANRGEIACRIMRTLRALGLESVAVFHHEDRRAPHVEMADHAVALEGRIPANAYLDQPQIIVACRDAGADAVHPGYGFLAENAEFAQAVRTAGLTFIGPDPDVIRLMGDKIRARGFAAANGVPVVPGAVLGDDCGLQEFIECAEAIGFPILIKATAGGGGKGMKVVGGREDLREAVRLAASEAVRYFGSPGLYAEKLIERPRHIEVQVLGDAHGNVAHLGERECSVQRRYQKIIEEAPAPQLDPRLRERVCRAAVTLARAAGYRNAGTVEFIVDGEDSFYFLEMNTRLQVEHAVTELVYGIDLVAEQVRIAAGEPLSDPVRAPRVHGHAVECRVCAELPHKEFQPATGTVGVLHVPSLEGIRIDLGIRAGQAITSSFDPLLAKVVSFGATRAEAISRMTAALRNLVVLGVPTNIDYLAAIMQNDAYRDGRLHTGFLIEQADRLAGVPPTGPQRVVAALAALFADPRFRDVASGVPEPYASIGGWRN